MRFTSLSFQPTTYSTTLTTVQSRYNEMKRRISPADMSINPNLTLTTLDERQLLGTLALINLRRKLKTEMEKQKRVLMR
jgi:hypothetical protein